MEPLVRLSGGPPTATTDAKQPATLVKPVVLGPAFARAPRRAELPGSRPETQRLPSTSSGGSALSPRLSTFELAWCRYSQSACQTFGRARRLAEGTLTTFAPRPQ